MNATKMAIIADDFTGACDTAVQPARSGRPARLFLDWTAADADAVDVAAFDTDSRSADAEEAYRRVGEICELILERDGGRLIYKKIDSTLRGNIGAELDAVYDRCRPDLIAIAPAFPETGRTVRGGVLLVDGVPVHETVMARDPKNPVRRSFIPDVVGEQSVRPVGVIGLETVRGDPASAASRIESCLKRCRYLVFDAESGDDLRRIVAIVRHAGLRAVWCGSAMLARALAETANAGTEARPAVRPGGSDGSPVLLVVGSVHPNTRRQLEVVLRERGTVGIEMRAEAALAETAWRAERERLRRLTEDAMRRGPKAIALYSSADRAGAGPHSLPERSETGADVGRFAGNRIGGKLGEWAAEIVAEYNLRRLVLTGGDTAKSVCGRLGARAVDLLDEVETGVAVGRLLTPERHWIATKAGGFGGEDVLRKTLRFFGGG